MAQQQNHNEVAFLARLAGLTVPEDRLSALAAGLTGLQAVAEALVRVEYGAIEPASRFQAPRSR